MGFDFPRVPYFELLRRSVQKFPEKPAVIFQQKPFTFAWLEEESNRLASALAELDVQKGDRVVLSMFNRPEFLVSTYGILKRGAVVVPVNPSYKTDEASHLMADSGAKIVLVQGRDAQNISDLRSKIPGLQHVVSLEDQEGSLSWNSLATSSAPPVPPPINVEEDLAALPYSSGTTGRPKGVMLTHQNLLCSHHQYLHAGKVTEKDVSLLFVPLIHVYGFMLMGGAIATGATQVLMERFNLEESLKLTAQHRITLYYATTSVLLEMAACSGLENFDLSSIRYINSGGAPLPKEIVSKVKNLTGVHVANGYGMTEAPISGSFVPGEERKIVDLETGERELPPGETGELVIRGPQVMKGYWQDPEETAKVLRDGWLHTGDIGFLDEKQKIRIVARKKEIIKYKGFAISPGELEDLLLGHPAISDCAVVGKPDPKAGEIPKAYVVVKEGNPLTPDEIMAYIAERVSGYKKIREVALVESIPRNQFGKVLKRLL